MPETPKLLFDNSNILSVDEFFRHSESCLMLRSVKLLRDKFKDTKECLSTFVILSNAIYSVPKSFPAKFKHTNDGQPTTD